MPASRYSMNCASAPRPRYNRAIPGKTASFRRLPLSSIPSATIRRSAGSNSCCILVCISAPRSARQARPASSSPASLDGRFQREAFAEAGFGGVIHTGDLEGDDDGPELGCRVLFHEYLGAGYRFNAHWNVMAQIAHSSHANLCDGPNDGMTRAGLQIGYKF
ncbi:acyloxyacyl hydrolase [Rhizobium leguminosarum]|uniref:Acyloxyacyl hydrolase n=1 Tax=Rhizobium leguminosarum TaxID=384 RepID=A0A444HKY7_RHILE|nr:acyloxyacyl hydrolase [Rhizobium leguminosarum]